ncbi:exported hypothetical protein [Azospirillaceae bacterium]
MCCMIMSRTIIPRIALMVMGLALGSAATKPAHAGDDMLVRAGEVVSATVSTTISAVTEPIAAILAATTGKPADNSDRDDAIDDRGLIELTLNVAADAWTWFSYTMGSMFASVTPPTPTTMIRDLQDDRQSEFFQFLGYSGYKLKEIENGVGLPPRHHRELRSHP